MNYSQLTASWQGVISTLGCHLTSIIDLQRFFGSKKVEVCWLVLRGFCRSKPQCFWLCFRANVDISIFTGQAMATSFRWPFSMFDPSYRRGVNQSFTKKKRSTWCTQKWLYREIWDRYQKKHGLLGDFSHILFSFCFFLFGFMGKFCLIAPPKTPGKRHGTIYKIFGMPLKGPRKLFRPPPPTVPGSQILLFKVYSFQKTTSGSELQASRNDFHFSSKPRESLFFGESFNLTWNIVSLSEISPGSWFKTSDVRANDLKSEIL